MKLAFVGALKFRALFALDYIVIELWILHRWGHLFLEFHGRPGTEMLLGVRAMRSKPNSRRPSYLRSLFTGILA